jgi:hypothetical protein
MYGFAGDTFAETCVDCGHPPFYPASPVSANLASLFHGRQAISLKLTRVSPHVIAVVQVSTSWSQEMSVKEQGNLMTFRNAARLTGIILGL